MTTVNIDVSDVNDNAPVFAQGNYSVIIQVPWALGAHCAWPFGDELFTGLLFL